MTSRTSLRIHPAIGIARVGTSQEYYLGPETMAAAPGEGVLTGGLPIKPGEDSKTITSNDLRDAETKLKRQAARFKLYQYQDGDTYSYPSAAGEEVVIGSVVDGARVKDIVWTVHLANKKVVVQLHIGANDGLLRRIKLTIEKGLPNNVQIQMPGQQGELKFSATYELRASKFDDTLKVKGFG